MVVYGGCLDILKACGGGGGGGYGGWVWACKVVNGGLRGWLLHTEKESNRKRERERNE